MSDETLELLTSVLSLPPAVRARFAHEILASLDDRADADAEDLWRAEIERRAEDVLAGRAELVDADIVHEQLTARLRAMSR
jgi:putative addiction module component (TIGR02574 family)